MNKSLYCQCHEPCFALCINPKCPHPGAMCQQGMQTRSQCGYDHQTCKKIQWSQFQRLVNQNPRKNIPEFHQVQNKIDQLFIELISKIREEHMNFKFWLTTYGLSLEVVDLIGSINEERLESVTGRSVYEAFSELTVSSQLKKLPKIDQKEISRIKQTISIEFVNLAQVYLNKLKKQQQFQSDSPESIRQSTQTLSTQHQDHSFLKQSRTKFSKVIDNPNQLLKLFTKPIKTMKLLYRASQHNFSTRKFHQQCDGIPHTLVVIRNQHNKVFGGYTTLKWSKQKKGFESDSSGQSFMFNLQPTEKYKLTLPQFAIAQSVDGGPVFGCNDLVLVDQGNVNQSKSEFPICYKSEKLKRGVETSLRFCGSKIGKFLVKEWEVFMVEFEGQTQGVEEEFLKIF